jgi:hypothetical protein
MRGCPICRPTYPTCSCIERHACPLASLRSAHVPFSAGGFVQLFRFCASRRNCAKPLLDARARWSECALHGESIMFALRPTAAGAVLAWIAARPACGPIPASRIQACNATCNQARNTTCFPTNQQTNQHFSTMFLKASFARGKSFQRNEIRIEGRFASGVKC